MSSDPSIPLSVLAQFHRNVIVPDIERIVGASERRLRDEMHTMHDALINDIERLEFEYQAIRAGLARMEERLERVEQRLESVEQQVRDLGERISRLEKRLETRETAEQDLATRAEVHQLRTRVEDLQARLDEIERRLPR